MFIPCYDFLSQCPATREELTADDLLEVRSDKAVKPRPVEAASIPGLLAIMQARSGRSEEWGSVPGGEEEHQRVPLVRFHPSITASSVSLPAPLYKTQLTCTWYQLYTGILYLVQYSVVKNRPPSLVNSLYDIYISEHLSYTEHMVRGTRKLSQTVLYIPLSARRTNGTT